MTATREAAASVCLDGTTHWKECWRVHPECAKARKQKARRRWTRAQMDAAVETLGQLNDRLVRARCKRNRGSARALKQIAREYRALGMVHTAAQVEAMI